MATAMWYLVFAVLVISVLTAPLIPNAVLQARDTGECDDSPAMQVNLTKLSF